jgi:hypothetical protein
MDTLTPAGKKETPRQVQRSDPLWHFSQAKHTQRFTNRTLPEVRSGAGAHHLMISLTRISTPHKYATEGAQHPHI